MLKAFTKTIIIASLLTLLASHVVRAEVKHYQYDGKLPFVQMMLNMMVAMGILDRIPVNGMYGGYGSSAYPSSPWSSFYSPYSNGFNSGYGNNPFLRSPWLQSPWSQSGLNNPAYASPLWGSPNWGVLPPDLDGWVNEPWEASVWNPKAESPAQSAQPAQPNVPLVQNFNYGAPANSQQDNRLRNDSQRSNNINRQSPLAKLAQPGPLNRHSIRPHAPQQKKPSPLRKKAKPNYRQKPCVTEFCGLKKPNLNGLWVAQNGEMLGVKNDRFLWADSKSRYLTGQIKIQNEYLLASVEGSDKLMRFKYKLAGDHLLTLQPDGKIREFIRMPNNQYSNPYQDYYW